MKSNKHLNEQGSVLLFGIGLSIAVLMVLTTAINIASLWVTKSKLNSIADATAIAASNAIDVSRVYEVGLTDPLPLDEQSAKRKAMSYLNRLSYDSDFNNFQVLSIQVTRKNVEITVQADVKLPFGYLLTGSSPTITARAKAALLQNDYFHRN